MINSIFEPFRMADLDVTKVSIDDVGVSQSCAAGASTNVDLYLTDDVSITGIQLLAKDSVWGDTIGIQVVNTIGTLPGGQPIPMGVVKTIASNIYVVNDKQEKFLLLADYPSKAVAGLTLRLIYNSTGGSAVSVAVNWKLHNILS